MQANVATVSDAATRRYVIKALGRNVWFGVLAIVAALLPGVAGWWFGLTHQPALLSAIALAFALFLIGNQFLHRSRQQIMLTAFGISSTGQSFHPWDRIRGERIMDASDRGWRGDTANDYLIYGLFEPGAPADALPYASVAIDLAPFAVHRNELMRLIAEFRQLHAAIPDSFVPTQRALYARRGPGLLIATLLCFGGAGLLYRSSETALGPALFFALAGIVLIILLIHRQRERSPVVTLAPAGIMVAGQPNHPWASVRQERVENVVVEYEGAVNTYHYLRYDYVRLIPTLNGPEEHLFQTRLAIDNLELSWEEVSLLLWEYRTFAPTRATVLSG